MPIPIKDNTTALNQLKTKAEALPDRGSGGAAPDISGLGATDSDVRSGVSYYGSNGKSTGNLPSYSGWSQTAASNGTISIPDGIHSGSTVKINVAQTGGGGNETDFSRVTATEPDVREGKIFYDSDGVLVYGGMEEAEMVLKGIFDQENGRALVYVEVPEDGYIDASTYGIGELPTLDDSKYTLDITREGSYGIATEGKYLAKNIAVSVDAGDDFKPENIVKDKTILGIKGTHRGSSLNEYADYPEYSKTLLFKEVSGANTYYIVKEDQTEMSSTTGCVAVMSALLDFSNNTQYVYIYDKINARYLHLAESDNNVRLTIETVEAGDATAIRFSGVFDNTHYDNDLNITVVTEKLEFYGRYKVYAF